MTRLRLHEFRQDLRLAVRSIRQYPVACAVAVISLAAGIGCTTATLTIRDAIFYNPPPLLQNPEELSIVGLSTPDRPQRRGVPAALYTRWVQERSLVAGIAARTRVAQEDVRIGSNTVSVPVQAVSTELFSVLGVNPLAGRTFSADDLTGGGASAAVLSYDIWQRVFAGDVGRIGDTIFIDQRPYTVTGVMPRRYRSHRGIWIPFDPNAVQPDEELEVVIRRHARMPASHGPF